MTWGRFTVISKLAEEQANQDANIHCIQWKKWQPADSGPASEQKIFRKWCTGREGAWKIHCSQQM